MKWFDRWLYGKVKDMWDNSSKYSTGAKLGRVEGASALIESDNQVEVDGIQFKVMAANGGVIVQTRTFNPKIDRNIYNTHIIPDGEDIAERVGQIVSLELLRH
jgi:hypothetical protein